MNKTEKLMDFLKKTIEANKGYLEKEEKGGEFSPLEPKDLDSRLSLSLGSKGQNENEVLKRLTEIMSYTPSSSNWKFLNQLFGGRIDVSLGAEVLSLLANTSLYTFKAAGSQVLVENQVLAHVLGKVGFPQGEGAFTPGGSMANMVAMVLARARSFPEARDHGLGSVVPKLYTSAEAHYSIPKNAGILGLGRNNVRKVPCTPEGKMDPEALENMIQEDQKAGAVPFFINATAGTTVRGAFDSIAEIAPIAEKYNCWLHVDGALGGTLVLSDSHRSLLAGLDKADSMAWNAHKMMGVSLQTSMILVAKKGQLAASLDETADYLFQSDDDQYNPGHRSIQCGRRNDALRLWAAWSLLGDEGWNQRIAQQLEIAQRAAALVQEDPDLELVEYPPSINLCFKVKGKSSEEVCDRLNKKGTVKIGHGDVRGQRVIRLVCVNPDLDEEKLKEILREIKEA